MSIDVGPEHGVHAGKVSLSVGLEPFDHIAVEAEMDRGLPCRHDDAGIFPEVGPEGLGFGGVGAGLVLAVIAHGFDLAKGVSRDGRFLVHLGSLSGR